MKKNLLFFLSILLSVYTYAQVGIPGPSGDDQIELDYRNPKVYEIAEITVRGAEFHDNNAIISISGLKVGDEVKIPGDDISGAIEKIWELGIIGDISIFVNKIEDNRVWLTIDLKERPRLTRITYSGVSKTQQSELNDQIKLIRGRVLTDVVIKNTELSVRKYFVEKGFLNTEVNIIQREDTLVSNSVQIIIEVDKKQKVKINDLIFYGNEQFMDAKLGNKMKNTNEHLRFHLVRDLADKITSTTPEKLGNFLFKTHQVSWQDVKAYFNDKVKLNFFRTSKFIQNDYREDQKSLINFYNSRGYRDARIIDDTIYNVSPNKINIEITVDEGIKYYFRDVEWTGNFVYEEDVLNRVLGITKGDVYNMELINKKLSFNPSGTDINGLYMDNGYLAFTCVPVETEIDGDSIDVEMRINEGRQFDINKVIVRGNDRTSDHVIRREIRTLPGEKFSRSDLIRTQRELSQLGYFDPEQIGINPLPNFQNGTVDIEYTLVEKPSDQIELSGGWGGFYGFVGTLGLVFNNFSIKNITNLSKWRPLPVGDGQRLQLRAQANGRAFQSYSFSFTEPWLGGKKPNAFTVALQRSVQRTNIFGSEEFQGSLKVSGGSVSLTRRVRWPDDYFTISNSLSYYLYELNDYGYRRLGFSDGIANNFTFNTTIARNSIDAPMYPRYGSNISLSVSLTPPYSNWRNIDYNSVDNATKWKWVEYHKWMFDATFHQKLAGNLVATTKAHIGYIGNYGVPVGPFERFVMGGSGLAGGFNTFLLGTDIIALRGYDDLSLNPVDRNQGVEGGIAYNKFVFELRYPVSLNPSATIYVLGFGEAGGNWNNYAEFNPFDLQRSAGVGARIFMPAFGLLGIDWGYGFDPIPGQTKDKWGSQFHFTIGQQFR